MSDELTARFEKRFPRGPVIRAELRQAINGFSMTVLFGPSGCGKTTLLRCLAGLERPDSGTIEFAGQTWFDAERQRFLSPQERDIGFLFQEYALFPHLTVSQNIGYGLRTMTSVDRSQRVNAMLEHFQLEGLADRFPHQISGGQQQRVALARAVARRPRLLLLDEPLSALDICLREELRRHLRQMLGEFAIPVILVTHDRNEAIALADRIVVMEAGTIRQQGTATEVFSHPIDSTVARIVGIETIAPGEIVHVEDGLATVQVGGVTVVAVAPTERGRYVNVCIKGEDVILHRDRHNDSSVRNQLAAMVTALAPEGPLIRVGLDCGFELSALVTRPASAELRLAVGDAVTACVKAPSIHLVPRNVPL